MTPEVISALGIAIQTREPVVVWGDPGIGKTAVMNALAKGLSRRLVAVIASIREPSDFGGLPIVGEDRTRLAPPSWALEIKENGKSLLFLDEVSTAPPATQAALLRVVLERVVGELELPEDTAIVAAANPPESAAGGWELTPPLANRLCHLYSKADVDVWCAGMLAGFPTPTVPIVPDGWEQLIPKRMTLIATFIKRRPELLIQLPTEAKLASGPWPSPRSWTKAARLWAACGAAKAGKDVTRMLLAGCVGEGPAMELLTWVKDLDLPDPERILLNPTELPDVARGDSLYVVLSAVISAVIRNNTPTRWSQAWKVLAVAKKRGTPDIAAFAARMLAKNQPQGIKVMPPEVTEFTAILMASSGK